MCKDTKMSLGNWVTLSWGYPPPSVGGKWIKAHSHQGCVLDAQQKPWKLAVAVRKTKMEVYRLVLPDGAASSNHCCFARRKREALSQESRVEVSALVRKWIHVIWMLPGGREMLMAGLSILMERLYPISTLSQPIQLLPLIAFIHLLLHPSLLCLFWRGHQLTNVFLRSHLSLTLIFCCQHTCLSACVRMNRQYRREWHCVHRGGGGGIPGSKRLHRQRKHAWQHSRQQSIQSSSQQKIIDSTHVCTSRRLT